jgi:hypothetical protein
MLFAFTRGIFQEEPCLETTIFPLGAKEKAVLRCSVCGGKAIRPKSGRDRERQATLVFAGQALALTLLPHETLGQSQKGGL